MYALVLCTLYCIGTPNCPTVHTTVTTSSLTVTIQKALMTWLPEWYCVKAIFYNGSIAVYNSTLKATASFNVTPLQPSTVYNISVIPCNMAGCNGSCDIHSVQTESDTGMGGEMNGLNAQIYILHCYYALSDCRTCIACFSLYSKENIHFLSPTHFFEPGSDVIPLGTSLPLLLIFVTVVVILVAMALLLLAILGSAFLVCLYRRLVFITWKFECMLNI